jgi:hypothetical protein
MKIFEVLSPKYTDETIIRILRTDCAPFLSAIGHNIYKHGLYRGIEAKLGEFSKQAVPVGRKPVDTPSDMHEAADDWFAKKFGVRYRSNAVFCTGSKEAAEEYGYLYAVFPIGAYSFCYSPIVNDLTAELELGEYRNTKGKNLPVAKLVPKVLDQSRYIHGTTAGIINAINSGHEVMVHCANYYAIDLGDDPTRLSKIQWA